MAGSQTRRRKLPCRRGAPSGLVKTSESGASAVYLPRCRVRAGLMAAGTATTRWPASVFGGPNRQPPPGSSDRDRSTPDGAGVPPVTVSVSKILYHPEAIMLAVTPLDDLTPIRGAALAATIAARWPAATLD